MHMADPVACADAVLDGRGLPYEPQAAAAPHGGRGGGQQTPSQDFKIHGQVSGQAACRARALTVWHDVMALAVLQMLLSCTLPGSGSDKPVCCHSAAGSCK